MIQPLRQCKCPPAPRQGLVGIPQDPQDPRQPRQTDDSHVRSSEGYQRSELLGIVEGDRAFKMMSGQEEPSPKQPGFTQGPVSQCDLLRILSLLRQAVELLSPRAGKIGLYEQRLEELRRPAHLLAQLVGPIAGIGVFGSAPALQGQQRGAQGELEGQLSLSTFRGFGHGFEQRQPSTVT